MGAMQDRSYGHLNLSNTINSLFNDLDMRE